MSSKTTLVYNSLAESYIQYGLSSYGRTYATYLNQIYKLQIKILKNIVSTKIRLQFKDDDMGLFKHCNVLPIEIQFMHSILKENFFNETLFKVINHPVHTRAIAQNRFGTTRANNVYGERTAHYLVPRLMNKLPSVLINVITQKNIKYKLKSYLLINLNNYFKDTMSLL